MIDDGIDLTHPGLADASVTEHFFGGATKESSTTYTDEIFFQTHSHTVPVVAGSILANGHVADHFLNFYGNANAAHLHVFTVPKINGNPKFYDHITEITDFARDKNIRILNVSISFS